MYTVYTNTYSIGYILVVQKQELDKMYVKV